MPFYYPQVTGQLANLAATFLLTYQPRTPKSTTGAIMFKKP